MMTSEEFSDSSITKMQQELTGYLVAAEKLMSLRQANLPHLQSLVEKIEKQYCDLLQNLSVLTRPQLLIRKNRYHEIKLSLIPDIKNMQNSVIAQKGFRNLPKMRIAIPLIPCAIRGPLSRPDRLHHRDLALNFVKLKLNFELLS